MFSIQSLDNYVYKFIYTKSVKFLNVSDLHLSYIRPRSRIDNYYETILEKVEFICKTAADEGCNFIIQNGDVTHSASMLNHTLFELQAFSDILKKYNIPWFIIIGNHDYFGNLNHFQEFPTGELIYNGALNPFIKIEVVSEDGDMKPLDIYGFWYVSERSLDCDYMGLFNKYLKTVDTSHYNLGVIHQLVESLHPKTFYISLSELKKTGFDMMFVGHDHRYKGFTDEGGIKAFQPGGVSRNTSHYDDMTRTPVVGIFTYDGLDLSLKKEISIPVKSLDKCFNLDRIEYNHNIKEVSNEDSELSFLNNSKEKPVLTGWNMVLDLLKQKSKPDVYRFIKNISDEIGL